MTEIKLDIEDLTSMTLRLRDLEGRFWKTRRVKDEIEYLETGIEAYLNPIRRELDEKIAKKLREARHG